LSLRTTD